MEVEQMDRAVVRLDQEALRRAAEEFGTTTKVDTINEALHEIVRMRGHRRVVQLLAESDIANPEVMRGAWRH
jgi:Arc/MetJ family transcription regulator